jgi:hypothetical protein
MNACRPLCRRAASIVLRRGTSSSIPSLLVPTCDGVFSRRHFSRAKSHEHDEIRHGWGDSGDEVDYWKAHKDDRAVVDEAIEVIDYWKDHNDSHSVAESSTSVSGGAASSFLRNFSTTIGETTNNNTPPSPVGHKEGGPLIDYWTRHNDSHYTDYWDEHDHTHI